MAIAFHKPYSPKKTMDIYDTLPTLRNDLQNDDRIWREIDGDSFDEMMNCVPPLRLNSLGFLSSEPYTHLQNGDAIYLSCIAANEKFWAAYLTLKDWKSVSIKSIPKLSQ